MVIKNKKMLIEKLTGIHSSKKTYYVELKKKIAEVSQRNIQLEIINQLAKSMGIDMSLKDVIENIIPKLQTLVYFNTLSLYIILKDELIKRVVFFTDNGSEIHESIIKYSELQKPPEDKDMDTYSALWYVLNK